MARLDLGIDPNGAGWPKTPGIGKALSIASKAEDAHRNATAIRSMTEDRDQAMDRLGRALLDAVSKGEVERSRLPVSVTGPLDEALSSMQRIDGRE